MSITITSWWGQQTQRFLSASGSQVGDPAPPSDDKAAAAGTQKPASSASPAAAAAPADKPSTTTVSVKGKFTSVWL